MKKNIVLFVLFVLPIVAYLFFASGVNSFTKLPVITPKIADFGNWKSLDGKKVSLDKKITVLGFSGSEILNNRGNYFNLNELSLKLSLKENNTNKFSFKQYLIISRIIFNYEKP